jgi:hypothetical protein
MAYSGKRTVLVNGRAPSGPEACVALCVAVPVGCCLAGAVLVGLVVAPLAACCILTPLLCCLPCAVACCPPEQSELVYVETPSDDGGPRMSGFTNGRQYFYAYDAPRRRMPPGVDDGEVSRTALSSKQGDL